MRHARTDKEIGQTTEPIRHAAQRMTQIPHLRASPVGVRFIMAGHALPGSARRLSRHCYCQALMRARGGLGVLLDADGISCPAAASAFGFRPLPDGLASGKSLVGFGIVSEAAVGRRMFEGMPRLPAGECAGLWLFPLEQASAAPDVVVVEDEVERLMWLALATLHARGGERIVSSTAVLQATCVDATLIPYLEQRLNLSYGCYGCRDATDIRPGEAVLGFPGALLAGIMEHLDYLHQKAIPASRSKRAWSEIGRMTATEDGPDRRTLRDVAATRQGRCHD